MADTGYDTIVIGAGASGMVAAISAARRGKPVLVLEQLSAAGKKLLATGNGKCNFTNERITPECYHGDLALIQAVLSRFSRDDCLNFFQEIGIFPKNRHGYYYPNSEQASSVRDALLSEMKRCGVTLAIDKKVQSVTNDMHGWLCRTKAASFRAGSVIFASGLSASPKLGSDGSAIPILKELGHRFAPVLPALCGFRCKGMHFKRVSGVRCDALLTLEIDGRKVKRERGELQLADYGLSGIPTFQLSSEAVRALYEKRRVMVHLDFLPDLTEQELADELARRKNRSRSVEQLLCGLVNSKLGEELLETAKIRREGYAEDLPDEKLTQLASLLKDRPVQLAESRGTEYAQVCTGGVRAEEIDCNTLESRLHKGLYLVGELLDADGICGGYNLHWAWATGYIAGNSLE